MVLSAKLPCICSTLIPCSLTSIFPLTFKGWGKAALWKIVSFKVIVAPAFKSDTNNPWDISNFPVAWALISPSPPVKKTCSPVRILTNLRASVSNRMLTSKVSLSLLGSKGILIDAKTIEVSLLKSLNLAFS